MGSDIAGRYATRKYVRLDELRGYLDNGWQLVVIAAAPPPNCDPTMRLIEYGGGADDYQVINELKG